MANRQRTQIAVEHARLADANADADAKAAAWQARLTRLRDHLDAQSSGDAGADDTDAT